LQILISDVSSEEMDEAVKWLDMYNEPQSRVDEMWMKTSKRRLAYIHSSEQKPTLQAILVAWPRLADPKGYLLVSC
jgi:hypothetical protein